MFFLAQVNGPASSDNASTQAVDDATAENGDAAAEAAEAAQQVAETADPSWFSEMIDSGAIGLLLEGGFFMWPILILGILALAVIIERWRSLKMLNADSSELREQVLEYLSADQVEDALNHCDRERGPVAAVLSNGLRKYLVLRRLNYDQARIEEQVVKSMENYGIHIVAALERHLPILAIVSSVAPMLGFLGTV
ncbi:MAG: MotA/TolQ/ExbB proton channel family protein, partial [Verrucomicrobiota bacterium]